MNAKAKYCPHCGVTLAESDGPFCDQCGSSLAAPMDGLKCARCQGWINDTDIYCMHCCHFISFDA